jgi:hypothetical protein
MALAVALAGRRGVADIGIPERYATLTAESQSTRWQ